MSIYLNDPKYLLTVDTHVYRLLSVRQAETLQAEPLHT